MSDFEVLPIGTKRRLEQAEARLTHAREYLDTAIAGFDRDPPSSGYQQSFLDCLKVVRAEAFATGGS